MAGCSSRQRRQVVGDLAQFMVTNKIETAEQLVERSTDLDLPSSVCELLQGKLCL